MALAAIRDGWIGAAKSNVLVDRDIVLDLCGFTNDAEPMIKKKPLADLRSGVNVDRSQEPRKMVDEPRQKNTAVLPKANGRTGGDQGPGLRDRKARPSESGPRDPAI